MLSIALVGCGRVTQIAHLDALKKLADHYKIAAVCDVSADALKMTAKATGARAYSDYETLLKSEQPDLLVLNVANGLHAPMAMQAIEAGVAAVAVEKPLAMSVEEADVLIALAQSRGTRLFTILQNRYNPPVTRVKQALGEGRFGKLLSAQVSMFWHRERSYYEGPLAWHADRKMAGGVLTNQSVHYLDLLLWLADQNPQSVYAAAGHRFGLEVEDYAAALVSFEAGLIATVNVTNHAPGFDREGSVTLIGERGMARIGGKALNRMELWAFDESRPEDAGIYAAATEPPTVYGYGHFDFYRAVADCLQNNACADVIDAREGRRSLVLLSAIYKSIETGDRIRLD